MKALKAIFRMYFNQNIQYRVAALAGIFTQYAFGFMYILLYMALYRASPQAFPLTLRELMSYMWLQQGLLAMMMIWFVDAGILEEITSGNVAYTLCRPLDVFHFWLARTAARRLANTALRMGPLFLLAFLLPQPYGLLPPPSLLAAVLFLCSLALAFLLINLLIMLLYAATFYTMNASGVRMLFTGLVDTFSGSVLPLAFFPPGLRRALEWLPLGSLQNAPYLIYSGHTPPQRAVGTIALQCVWCAVFYALGRYLFARLQRQVAVQGG